MGRRARLLPSRWLAWGRASAAVLLVLVGRAAWAAPPADIFRREATLAPGDRAGRLLLDAQFGKAGSVAALRTALARGAGGPELEAEAWSFLCSQSYRDGRYRQAVDDCTRAMAADPTDADGNKDTLALVQRLRDEAPPGLEGTGARVVFDKDGRVPVVAGPVHLAAIADTGAQISVMMRSVAEKAGVRLLGKSGAVGTTTSIVVGETGILPRVEIGNAVLTRVLVLVLPDAQLTFAKGRFRIPFILGLHALRQFGRIAWLDHGHVLALGSAAPPLDAASVPVFWHPLGIGVPLDGAREREAAHFDTGANVTYLYDNGLSLLSDRERAKLVTAKRRIGGVGKVVVEKVRRLAKVTLRLDEQPLTFRKVDVVAPTKSGEAARLGADLFPQLGSVVLDFDRMRLSARR